MLTINQSGNLHTIRFSHSDRDQFNILVDCMKEIGAEWDKNGRVWVLAETKKADVLRRCSAISGTPSKLLDCIRHAKAELIGLPPMEVPPPTPDSLKLMDHQVSGVDFIAQREGSLMAWEIGVGKTPLAIASINAAGDKGFPSLIICPAHLKHNWYREFKGDPEMGKKGWLVDKSRTVGIAKGNYFPPTDVVIINYDIIDRHKKNLDSVDWAFAILDESHFCKSPKAKRTKCIIGGAKRGGHQIKPLHAKRRIALSGTPLVNKPEDLWAICHWLDPRRWPSQYWFINQFCTTSKREQWTKGKSGKPVKRMIREVLPPSKEQMEALNKRLTGTVMSRIRSKDVLDLPPLTRRVIEVDVGSASNAIRAEQKTLENNREKLTKLRAAVELAKASGNDSEYAAAIKALADFTNEEKEHVAILRQKIALAKVPYVIDHVRNILLDEDRKVLLFAHHHTVIEALYQAATEFLPDGVVHFYGKSTHEEKQDAEKRIQSDPGTRLFIGGITAAGTGLTLTAASSVVFAEEDWVPSNMRQCEGRAWRKGQENRVTVDHVVAYGSVDSLIAKRMISKQEISDQAIDSDLTLEEPIDWIADHQLPTDIELSQEISPYQSTTYKYGLQKLVKNPNYYHVSDLDLIIASQLAGKELTGKAAAYARHLAIKYLNESPDTESVRLPKV